MHDADADVLASVRTAALEASGDHDAAHDGLHLARVVANARQLAGEERGAGRAPDTFVVEAAAWLHDLVLLPKGEGPKGESARRSAEQAGKLLRSLAVAQARIDAICHAIEAHSFSGGLRPDTLEAAIVQDADRLDALGAIGIARLWVTGAALGGALYHSTDPAGLDRELDDRSFGLDHIERKLLRLPETMNTESGRQEALRRAEFVQVYRAEFVRELGLD